MKLENKFYIEKLTFETFKILKVQHKRKKLLHLIS